MNVRQSFRKNLRKPLALAALTLVGLAMGTGIASAHVQVTASDNTPGSFPVLTFKVPTESETASTTGITITLPTATPLESVSFQQVAGWTGKATTHQLVTPVKVADDTITEAVTSVTYTADAGGGIPPGSYATFALSVGPLPQTTALAFPVDQKYSDGTVVKWADVQAAGAAEPDHPVPNLTLGAAGSTTGGDAMNHGATVASSSGSVTDSTDSTARVTAIAALILAALSVLIGAIALRRPAALAAATALAAQSAPAPSAARGSKPAVAKRKPGSGR